MNSIHKKDWAEDDWGGHSGMQSGPREDGEAERLNGDQKEEPPDSSCANR